MDADRKGFADVSDYCFVFFISSVTQAALKLKKKREKNPAPQGAAYENGKQYELAHHRHTQEKNPKHYLLIKIMFALLLNGFLFVLFQ